MTGPRVSSQTLGVFFLSLDRAFPALHERTLAPCGFSVRVEELQEARAIGVGRLDDPAGGPRLVNQPHRQQQPLVIVGVPAQIPVEGANRVQLRSCRCERRPKAHLNLVVVRPDGNRLPQDDNRLGRVTQPEQGVGNHRVHERRFRLDDDVTVMVNEIECRVPGCPPLETVIVFWTAPDRRHHWKVFKPVADVAEDDLPPWWMKDRLIVQDGACDCC